MVLIIVLVKAEIWNTQNNLNKQNIIKRKSSNLTKAERMKYIFENISTMNN